MEPEPKIAKMANVSNNLCGACNNTITLDNNMCSNCQDSWLAAQLSPIKYNTSVNPDGTVSISCDENERYKYMLSFFNGIAGVKYSS